MSLFVPGEEIRIERYHSSEFRTHHAWANAKLLNESLNGKLVWKVNFFGDWAPSTEDFTNDPYQVMMSKFGRWVEHIDLKFSVKKEA